MNLKAGMTTSGCLPGYGTIEVVAGCMFSGKTTWLIRRLKELEARSKRVVAFKPYLDSRYAYDALVSHDAERYSAIVVRHSDELRTLAADYEVVGIDEAQFWDEDTPAIVTELANAGKQVLIAGLDLDAQGKPFGIMPHLLALAEHVTKLKAVCAISGLPASFTYRKVPSEQQILLGNENIYEARSRKFFYNL